MPGFLLLRFDAPLMSFGAPIVDNRGAIQDFPALSMLTGLLANSLGYDHADGEKLRSLQERIRYAARQDRPGRQIEDYQTVDLGQPFMRSGWTTRGAPQAREGGEAAEGTHIRYRAYLADAVYTVALQLIPEEAQPDLRALEGALRNPERPLFIGRKCCLPASPILLGAIEATSLLDAIRQAPGLESTRAAAGGKVPAWWPADEASPPDSRLVPVTDERDWCNQIHGGRRFLRHGRIALTKEEPADA